MRRFVVLALTFAVTLSGCAAIVGADFDDLRPAGAQFPDELPAAAADKADAENPYTSSSTRAPEAGTKRDSGKKSDASSGDSGNDAALLGEVCDTTDPTKASSYQLAYLLASSGSIVPCPCASGTDCCYEGLGCLAK